MNPDATSYFADHLFIALADLALIYIILIFIVYSNFLCLLYINLLVILLTPIGVIPNSSTEAFSKLSSEQVGKTPAARLLFTYEHCI